MRRLRALSPALYADATVLLLATYVVLWSLHPTLLWSSSTTTGGDTGAHVAMGWYLRQHLGLAGHLTSWYPGWFDGMPLYSYYFVIPDLLAALASFVIPYAVAFKLATVAGSLLLPFAAYFMARSFRAPRPIPAAMAAMTVPFLFDGNFTIDGGNLYSTLAGEYSFSLSLSLALLAIGLFARGMATSKGRWRAAAVLSLALAAHVLPWMFAITGVLVTFLVDVFSRHGGPASEFLVSWRRGERRRGFVFATSAGMLSVALSAWWLVPFVTSQTMTNSMGYVNNSVSSFKDVFTHLGWWHTDGSYSADRIIIIGAVVALAWAFARRDRLGIVLTMLSSVSLGAYIADPQSVIWNERLVPFWYLSIYLSVGWLIGSWFATGRSVLYARRVAREQATAVLDADADQPIVTVDPVPAFWSTLTCAVVALLLIVPSTIPAFDRVMGFRAPANQVTNWSAWNYTGYEGKTAWPEYHGLMQTMSRVAATNGCGQAMWEYGEDESRFGTTMGLMLLPYWTNNCVGSMEGLLFESSATTPYHFIDQAELSSSPSNPQVGLPYGGLDFSVGVRHLQMLGVRYYLAESPRAVALADHSPLLRHLATTKPYLVTLANASAPTMVSWHIYRVLHSDVVVPLRRQPLVLNHASSRTAWLNASMSWWTNPSMWTEPFVQSGPSNWPRLGDVHSTTQKELPTTTISHVQQADQSISFDVSRIGIPVLVKISYFPRWHTDGASGPFRVSPNLMVVVPTQRHVTMMYGSSPAQSLGGFITIATLGGACYAWYRRHRRPR